MTEQGSSVMRQVIQQYFGHFHKNEKRGIHLGVFLFFLRDFH